MKKIIILISTLVLITGFYACEDMLNVVDPNQQNTQGFGDSEQELQQALIACYNRIRLEGTFARVGYTIDVVRGDEVWNSSQQWYLECDNLNAPSTYFMAEWPWRDWYHVINRANFILSKVDGVGLSEETRKEIAGQAYFLRGMAYYYLATYYQNVPIFTDYNEYGHLNTLYKSNSSQDEVFNLIESDLNKAMQMLPSRDKGGEWAKGRATCGAAAGYLARALMFRHKFVEAYEVLKDIINGKYGHYKLMPDYGDNFKEGPQYENNDESLFEVQFMDYGTGGTDEEWTPVNISPNATQGHAIESNYASQEFGSWGDLAASHWLINLFKKERCVDGRLDPRLYWTLVTYEDEYETYTNQKTAAYPKGDPRCNIIYQKKITKTPLSNTTQGGVSIAKYTYARLNTINSITVGLHCGINLRLMRYSDVLLLAAECENEINGPTQVAIDYINQVRRRVALPDLKVDSFQNKHHLFEWIANVERPKELGCENGRGIDLLRWGFFYDEGRFNQLIQHGYYKLDGTASTEELTAETATGSTFQNYNKGHEYFPIYQGILNANPYLEGNSANKSEDNGPQFRSKYEIHPVVKLK